MLEEIIFNLIAFSLFAYIFMFKMVKKNDTNYLVVLIAQAIGIAINFICILANAWDGIVVRIIMYLLSIVFPIVLIALEKNSKNFPELMSINLSKLFLNLGNSKAAKAQLINLVTKYPNSYKGHQMLAQIYEKEGGTRKAIDEYLKVIDIKSDEYDNYYKVASLLKDLGRKDEAIDTLNAVLNKKPDYLEATELLGDLLCEEERFKEAISVYSAALKFNPNNFDLYYNLGIAYTRINDFQTAKEYYDKAAQINSELYNGYYCLGQISLLYRDVELAEDYFTKALMGDLEADAYYELAKIAIIKNDKERAITFVNKAIEIDTRYIDIVREEPMFMMIRQYLLLPSGERIPEKNISEKEKEVIEHLNNTYDLTKSLNINEIKRNFKQKSMEKDLEYTEREDTQQREF